MFCWTQVKSEMDKLFEEIDEGDKVSEVEPCSVSLAFFTTETLTVISVCESKCL